jgi:uncharacterized protein (DUF4415 family)
VGKPKNLRDFIIMPTDEEDAAITKAAMEDPDTWLMTDEEMKGMRPATEDAGLMAILRKHGRPVLPEAERKQRVTLYLDPDVLARLKADGKGWQTRANAQLRKGLGL